MAITGKVNASEFIPKLWEGDIMRAYEKKLIAKHICAMNPNAKIEKFGDVVHFPMLEDPAIKYYVPHGINSMAAATDLVPSSATAGTTITYDDLVSHERTLEINRAPYFSFEVDDILEAQSNVGVRGSQTQRAGYMLRDEADRFILGLAPGIIGATEGTNITTAQQVTATVNNANVLSSIGKLKRILEDRNVPNEECFIVIPPWVKMMLKLAGIQFSILEGTKGVKDGVEWTSDLGFDMYVSNNLKALESSGARVGEYIVGGSKKATCYANQIKDTEALRLEDKFCWGVRGLNLYGAKIIKPELMVLGIFTEGAPTNI